MTNAEGILNKMMSRIPLYEAKMVDGGIFQVFYIRPPGLENMNLTELNKEDKSLDSTIPVFLRIRTVSVDSQGTMICTCCLFERQGLPCIHQACVTDLCHKSVRRSFSGFTHHDIHVQWRSDYMHYAYKNSTHPDMCMKYHCIAIKSCGLNLQMEFPSSLPVHPRMDILPAIDCLKNYSKEDIDETALTNRNITTKHNLGNFGNDDLHDKWLDIMAEELRSAT